MAVYLPVRASIPPLSGVFQQGGTRRTKFLAPLSHVRPAIPAHREGDGFALFCILKLVISNYLVEEKAGYSQNRLTFTSATHTPQAAIPFPVPCASTVFPSVLQSS